MTNLSDVTLRRNDPRFNENSGHQNSEKLPNADIDSSSAIAVTGIVRSQVYISRESQLIKTRTLAKANDERYLTSNSPPRRNCWRWFWRALCGQKSRSRRRESHPGRQTQLSPVPTFAVPSGDGNPLPSRYCFTSAVGTQKK